jgi:hypothetical protein
MKYVLYFGSEDALLTRPTFIEQLSGLVSQIGINPEFRDVRLAVVDDGSKKLTDVFIELPDLSDTHPDEDMVGLAGKLLWHWRENVQPTHPILAWWLTLLGIAKTLVEGIPITSVSLMVVEERGIAIQLMTRSFV